MVIYTVVTGSYDTVRSKPVTGFDMVVLTDDPGLKVEGWKTIAVEPWSDPKKLSRYLKIMAHLYIDADTYIYIDANYEITGDLNQALKNYKGGYLAFNHPVRKCIYKEAERIGYVKKERESVLKKQMTAYYKAGYKVNKGLFANGFFIRDRSADQLCTEWWNQVNEYSYRDQLSLPYVNKGRVRSMGLPSGLLHLHPHQKYKITTPNVYYFSPNRGDKMLGEWYNRHCELVPNDTDWICLTDHDAMFLHPYSAKLIEDAIKQHGNEYDLFSCYTNRLGLKHQLPEGMDNDWGIRKNIEIANKYYDKYYCDVEQTSHATAGVFMLFQKKTWKANKFQDGIIGKDGAFIDWKFSNNILQSGGKIGILKGLFIYHLYRMWKKSTNIDHLR